MPAWTSPQDPGPGRQWQPDLRLCYKALKVRAQAEAKWPEFSENSRALISGFVAGYNRYLSDVAEGKQQAEPFCAGQPWVKPIEPEDVVTYLFSIALLPGAANFLDLIFYANPGDGDEYLPRIVGPAPASAAQTAFVNDINSKLIARAANISTPETNPGELGSNGWGLGKDKTENGKGMVLGNPHFPHTGNLRFWQSHATIPGHLDVMGGSLVGMPAQSILVSTKISPGPILSPPPNILWSITWSWFPATECSICLTVSLCLSARKPCRCWSMPVRRVCW